MGIWDIIWLQDARGFYDINRKRDGKGLLDSVGIWNSKFVWDIIWLQDTTGFQTIHSKRDGKW